MSLPFWKTLPIQCKLKIETPQLTDPTVTLISFCGSIPKFTLSCKKVIRKFNYQSVEFTITPPPNLKFVVILEGCYERSPKFSDVLSTNKLESNYFFSSPELAPQIDMTVTLHYIGDVIDDNIASFLKGGKMVTLIGSDGNVTVSKRLLKLRSKALLAKFVYDKGSLEINLSEYNVIELAAFCQFIENGTIQDGTSTAINLAYLGDCFDVPHLTSAAKKFILDNFKDFDETKALKLFYDIDANFLIEKAFKTASE